MIPNMYMGKMPKGSKCCSCRKNLRYGVQFGTLEPFTVLDYCGDCFRKKMGWKHSEDGCSAVRIKK